MSDCISNGNQLQAEVDKYKYIHFLVRNRGARKTKVFDKQQLKSRKTYVNICAYIEARNFLFSSCFFPPI